MYRLKGAVQNFFEAIAVVTLWWQSILQWVFLDN
jgi:hypothetical protein